MIVMLRKLFFVGAALLLSGCVSAQNYNKEKGAIRLLTYNTHYCKGATDPGELTKDNIENLGSFGCGCGCFARVG